MVKFEERFHGKEGEKIETRNGVFGVKKRFFGVEKRGNRWSARVRNPLLGVRVRLGSYRTPEEAALIVKKKMAEFEEMFKGQDNSNMGTCRGYFEGKKLPGGWGVRRQIGRNRVHIRHLKLENWVSGSSYRACEDVAIVADKNKEEFRQANGGKVGKLKVMSGDATVPSGVKRTQSGKWVARIKIPESKDRNWFGIFNTLEEAIGSFNKKKTEFDAKQKKPEFDCAESGSGSESSESVQKEGGEVETCDGDSGVKKRFLGVDKRGNRWRARARNPLLRATVHLGYYGTPEEAARVAKKKKVEFEEMFEARESPSMGTCKGYFKVKKLHSKDGVEVETRDGVSGAKKRFRGVTKVGNRWQARVRNPLLRTDFHLGYYGIPEEAALAVQKKKAEIEEMFKVEDRSSMGTCRGYFKGKKFPSGVSWDRGRYRVRIWHPKLKKSVSGGCYKTCEEAADAAVRKREELREMCGGKLGVIPENRVNDEVFKEPERVVASKSVYSEEQTGDVKVPPGVRRVRRLKSGKWAVTIEKPDSKARISLGTYNTLEEATSSYNKKKAEFDAKLKKPEFDWVKFRPGSEANETPMNFECESGYDCSTPLLDEPNLKKNALCDESSYDCGIIDIPAKLGGALVDRFPTSVFDPKNLHNAPGSDKYCASDFERAVSLGIINEYGQLQGKYSELDKHVGLSLAKENVADSADLFVRSQCRCRY